MATLAHDIVAFAETLYTVQRAWQPDGRVVRNAPIVLTNWQKRQLWDVFPPDNGGRPVVRNYLDSENKKLGKSTKAGIVAAFMATTEPHGEVVICAADKDQARDRVFKSIKYAVEHGPLGDHATAYRDLIEFTNGATITAFPMDWRGGAGGEPVCAIFDELHTYYHEGPRRLWDEMVIPPTLPYGIRWVSSYAGWEGESILLKEVWDKVKAGQQVADWPPIYHNDAAGWWGLIVQGEDAYQLVPWTRGDRGRRFLAEAAESERPASYIRLFKNEWASSEHLFVPSALWDACLDMRLKALPPDKTTPIHVGVDCAVKPGGDDSACIGVYQDGSAIKVAWFKVWRGGKGRKVELRLDKSVEPYLLRQAGRYNVQSINYDPRYMTNVANRLRDKRLPMVEITQSLPVLGPLGQTLYDAITDGRLRYYNHPDLKGMAAGVVAKEVTSGFHIKKDKTKADMMVALSFATGAVETGGPPAGVTIDVPMAAYRNDVYEFEGENGPIVIPKRNYQPLFRRGRR